MGDDAPAVPNLGSSPPLLRTSTSRSERSRTSYEIGETSAAGSLLQDSPSARRPVAKATHIDDYRNNSSPRTHEHTNGHARESSHDARAGRRSQRLRPTGGFLLSSPSNDDYLKQGAAMRDDGRRRTRIPVDSRKGKSPLGTPNRHSSPVQPRAGLSLEQQDMDGSNDSPQQARPRLASRPERRHSGYYDGRHSVSKIPSPRQTSPATMDVDSTQIVNMALNLSESRRLAQRRNISGPVPPKLASLPDSAGGGSLKQHLQQQRKTSRTISPKPDKGLSPRAVSSQGMTSPIPSTFDHDSSYIYHFSPSTLNRAQKAKEQLELMAQYRRLLHVLPPLSRRPQTSQIPSSPPASPTGGPTLGSSPTNGHPVTLGRAYDPLQYIRNRKVRARERMAINGEVQGFGDVSRVSNWVDDATTRAATSQFQPGTSRLPPFPYADALDCSEQPDSSLSNSTSGTAKPKRPRVDWIIDPADMIADLYWLEKDDNKHLIEDRHYSRILPRKTELPRAASKLVESPATEPVSATTSIPTPVEQPPSAAPAKPVESKSTAAAASNNHMSTRDRTRQKLREMRGFPHRHTSSIHSHHEMFRIRRSSLSDTSESESERKKRERSGTFSADGQELLEKQLREMMAKEAEAQQAKPDELGRAGSEKPFLSTFMTPDRRSSEPSTTEHSRRASKTEPNGPQDRASRARLLQESPMASGRPSLEVPPWLSRASLEFDSSQPTSPDLRPSRTGGTNIPNAGMDLSPPISRSGSPIRNPLSKVKHMFRDRSKERAGHRNERGDREDRIDSPIGHGSPISSPVRSPERHRSRSPLRNIVLSAGDGHRSQRSHGMNKFRAEDQIGIRHLIRGGAKIDGIIRGGMSKVSDILWRKDDGTSSSTSSDESDGEQDRGRRREPVSSASPSVAASRAASIRPGDHGHTKHYLDVMPSFKPHDKSPSADHDHLNVPVLSRPSSRQSSRFDKLKPPPLDVQQASPSLSPENRLLPFRRHSRNDSRNDSRRQSRLLHRSRDADASDVESHSRSRDSGSYTLGEGPRKTSTQLNAILSIPPPTSRPHRLSSTSLQNVRHWSISDENSVPRSQLSKREVARLRAMILSSGIKALEISRRANVPLPLSSFESKVIALPWSEIAPFAPSGQGDVLLPATEVYPTTARILAASVERTGQHIQVTTDQFSREQIPRLRKHVDALHERVAGDLTQFVRRAGDEADEVSRDIMNNQRLKVNRVVDTIDKMLRRRRRRFRWIRRAGWLAVEWVLVGFMWYVWFLVMIARVFLAVGKGFVGFGRWLLWL